MATVEVDLSELHEEARDLSRSEAREAAGRAFSRSQDVLYEAGDEHDYDVYPVAQAARPPQWDGGRGGFAFEYPHVASILFEVGTEPHEIEAVHAEMLAFEWPEAPPDVRKMFEETFPLIFQKSVDHPGTPAIGYFRSGMYEAERYLEGRR